MRHYIGCSGWSDTSWQGPFYPSNIENSGWLNYYSHVFDYVEIDSSFYRIPAPHHIGIVIEQMELLWHMTVGVLLDHTIVATSSAKL